MRTPGTTENKLWVSFYSIGTDIFYISVKILSDMQQLLVFIIASEYGKCELRITTIL